MSISITINIAAMARTSQFINSIVILNVSKSILINQGNDSIAILPFNDKL